MDSNLDNWREERPGLPATLRPLHLRALMKALDMAWARGVLPPADLDPERLWREARAATGLEEDLDGDFFARQLDVLLASIAAESDLSDFGRLVAHGAILKVMKERLRFAALWRRHPEIGEVPLPPVVVIVGPMRSGTTRLQRMLAAAGFDALRLYEALAPVPDGRWPDRRPLWTGLALWLLRSINPNVARIHPTSARSVDEELGLLEHSLYGALVEVGRWCPAFARHGERVDPWPAYRRMRMLLQLRQWRRERGSGRGQAAGPLVLKSPQYQSDLGTIQTVFPGARYLFTDRDPVAVVGSSASLAWHHLAIMSDRVDAEAVGREWLWKTAFRNARMAEGRKAIPPERQLAVDYARVGREPMAEMARIMGFLGHPWGPAAERATGRYLRRAARRRPHRYRLEDFGLNAGMVCDYLAGFTLAGVCPPGGWPPAGGADG